MMREEDLYPDIVEWLKRMLKGWIKDARYVISIDSHSKYLSDIVFDILRNLPEDLKEVVRRVLPSDYSSWVIKVDIFGMAFTNDSLNIAIIEVKAHDITVEDISQVIGYTKIVKPDISIILTTGGLSKGLQDLLIKHGRYDILEYENRHNKKQRICVLKWDSSKKDINYVYSPYRECLPIL